MEDTNNNPQGENNAQAADNGQHGAAYTPPATQEDLNRIIEGRLQRERSKYSDYEELKSKAASLDAAVAERDGLKAQVEAFKSENDEYKRKEQVSAWAKEVSDETGIPAELLTGDTKEAMQEQAKALGKYINVSAPVVRGDGKAPGSHAASIGEQLKEAIDGLIG